MNDNVVLFRYYVCTYNYLEHCSTMEYTWNIVAYKVMKFYRCVNKVLHLYNVLVVKLKSFLKAKYGKQLSPLPFQFK